MGLTVAEIRELTTVYLDETDRPFGPALAERLQAARQRLRARIAVAPGTDRRVRAGAPRRTRGRPRKRLGGRPEGLRRTGLTLTPEEDPTVRDIGPTRTPERRNPP